MIITGLRLSRRLTLLVILIMPSILASMAVGGTVWFPRLNRWLQKLVMRWWFRSVAFVFGLKVECKGSLLPAPALIASNHRSWLDIVVIGAAVDGIFVSKAEIRKWPLIGFFARYGGRSLFIHRGAMGSFRKVASLLAQRLEAGDRVIFFPEGTVSGDQGLLRFRPRLFEAALQAGCPVQPMALDYVGGDGQPHAPMHQGDQFAAHALRLLCCKRTHARIELLPGLEVEASETEPRALARACQGAVATVLESAMG